MSALDRLARRILRLEREVKNLGRTPQLAYSSVEGGSIDVADDDGVLRQIIGAQPDGSFTVVDKNGPAAPTPAAPMISTTPGLLVVAHYGTTADGAPWPADFRRIAVHVSSLSGFTPSPATKVGDFTDDGGSLSVALDPGVWHVKLVSVNSSGVESAPTAEVSATVSAPATSGGAAIYHSDTAPTGLDASDVAIWFDTDAGNLQHRWDGDTLAWVEVLVGPEATDQDALAGKRVPNGQSAVLQWGVPDPQLAPYAYADSWVRRAMPTVAPNPEHPEDEEPTFAGLVRYPDNQWAGLFIRSNLDWVSGTSEPYDYVEIHTWYDGDEATTRHELDMSLLNDLFGKRPGSMALIGTRLYVTFGEQNEIYVLDSTTFAWIATWAVSTVPTDPINGLGDFSIMTVGADTDGSLLVAYEQTGFAITVERRDATTGALLGSLFTTAARTSSTRLNGAPLAGTFDFGADRILLPTEGGDVLSFTRAGALQAGETFNANGASTTSVIWTESVFTFTYQFFSTYGLRQLSPLTASRSVQVAYTWYDDDPTGGGTHETGRSPIKQITQAARTGVRVEFTRPPYSPDVNAPKKVRIYAGVTGQPLTLQAEVDQYDEWSFIFLTTTGAAAPVISTFPTEGNSGVMQAESGGFVVRGDSTGDWPYFRRTIEDDYNFQIAAEESSRRAVDNGLRVDIDLVAQDVIDLDERTDAALALLDDDITGLDGRVDAIEAGNAARIQLTPTMAGVVGHAIYVKQIAKGTVGISGWIDVDDNDTTRRDSGMRIPLGMRPTDEVILAFPQYGGSGAYRLIIGTTGVVEFQQSVGNNGPYEGGSGIWFTE